MIPSAKLTSYSRWDGKGDLCFDSKGPNRQNMGSRVTIVMRYER
jgi:hypothetical protein